MTYMPKKMTPLEFLKRLESEIADQNTAQKIRNYIDTSENWGILNKSYEVKDETEPDIQIVYNAVKCLVCNKTIVSHHQHDYVTCGCENKAMVDGGTVYDRYGAADLSKILKTTLITTDPFDLIREHMSWGSYGKKGKDKLRFIILKDMSDSHIKNVLATDQGSTWVRELMQKELEYRLEFNISITD